MARVMKNTVCFVFFILFFSAIFLTIYFLQISNNPDTYNYNYTYRIVNSFPHDPDAFTQGLIYENNTLYEGTGLKGKSSLRKVDLETGRIQQIRNLSSKYFGEGITIFENKIIQLTWKSKIGFVYDKDSFDLLQTFNYTTEGWGITHDGSRLIMSDGTDTIYFLDPESFNVTGKINVFNDTGPITKLNELEYIKGEIYANIWQTDRIAIISPKTGEVTGWIDLTGLLNEKEFSSGANVLNGIAYDPENDRLFVTGKLWPKLFEIELVSIDD
jgi:glutamine cyclotransferase